MAAFRNALKSLANSALSDDELSMSEDIQMRNVGIVFPFISSSSSVIHLKQSFGNIECFNLQRSYRCVDYALQEYKQEAVKFKKFRKLLRSRLEEHTVNLPDIQRLSNGSVSLIMKPCHNYVECFNSDEVDHINAAELQKCLSANTGGPKRFRVVSTPVQCAENECSLLRVLMSNGTIVQSAKCMKNVVEVSADFPFEYKRDGKTCRLSTTLHLSHTDLSISSWRPISTPTIVTHLLNPAATGESHRGCDISFETHVDSVMVFDKDTSNEVQADLKRISDILMTNDWEIFSKRIRCKLSDNPGFSNVAVCSRRRSYKLQLNGVEFSLYFETKSKFRLDKETKTLQLQCRSSSFPIFAFPIQQPLLEENQKDILIAVSLLADRIMKHSYIGELRLDPLSSHIHISATNYISSDTLTSLRRLAFGGDFHEILGVSTTDSCKSISKRIEYLKWLVDTHCSEIAKINNAFDPDKLLEKLSLVAVSNV